MFIEGKKLDELELDELLEVEELLELLEELELLELLEVVALKEGLIPHERSKKSAMV